MKACADFHRSHVSLKLCSLGGKSSVLPLIFHLLFQVVSVLRPEEMFECVFTCGADCKGTSLYPCLQIFVNNSESNSVALLHFDEQQLVLNPKVSTAVLLIHSDPAGYGATLAFLVNTVGRHGWALS